MSVTSNSDNTVTLRFVDSLFESTPLKVVLAKSDLKAFLEDSSPIAEKGALGSKTFALGNSLLYYCPARSTTTAGATPPPERTTSMGPASDPKLVIVPLCLSVNKLISGSPEKFAPNLALGFISKLFNQKIFPKQADGKRAATVWRGQGLCHVARGKVQNYPVSVQWNDMAQGGQDAVPASSRSSTQSSRRSSMAARRQSHGSEHSNAFASPSSEARAQTSSSIQIRRASIDQSPRLSATSSRRSSVSSISSNASASSMVLRPTKLTPVHFCIKRFGLFGDVYLACCWKHDSAQTHLALSECRNCGKMVVYRSDLAFQVMAHNAQGDLLNLDPLVAGKAVDDAPDAGLREVLHCNVLQSQANLDVQGLIKGLKTQTSKWDRAGLVMLRRKDSL